MTCTVDETSMAVRGVHQANMLWQQAVAFASRYVYVAPVGAAGAAPASAIASSASSSSTRCCGSVAAASAGDMRSASASKRSMPLQKPPNLTPTALPVTCYVI